MARPFEFVKNISDRKELWKIAVKGTNIYVVVPPLYSQIFDSQLAANGTITISNFQVMLNKVVFKPSKNKYLLKLTGGTKPGGKKIQVNFVMRDESNTIKRTLWEGYVEKFIKYNQSKHDPNSPTVVMLQYAKVKEEGKYPLIVSNTYNVTKLSINEDLKPVNDFLKRFPKDTLSICSIQLSSQSQVWCHNLSNSTLTPYQKFMSKAIMLPISEIKQLKKYGWYYQACHQCPKAARGIKTPFKCESEHLTEVEIFRFKIQVEVVHMGCCCKFVLWDRESEQLLELSANHMRSTMIEIY
ncbi:unnamed protein product [Vicia faba]|uniref:Uncharacterized protein n=1 Tax=Vicia faba TaxID=3906 RepID=A0AAV0Z474_VICFA|nr:unnamed protein product [Vicia faba]